MLHLSQEGSHTGPFVRFHGLIRQVYTEVDSRRESEYRAKTIFCWILDGATVRSTLGSQYIER